MAAIATRRAIYTIHAERPSGSDILHYSFDLAESREAAKKIIRRENHNLRNNSTYRLITTFADTYSFDTSKSAYERALMKCGKADELVVASEEITSLIRCRIEPTEHGYDVIFEDKIFTTMQAPYPVSGENSVISLTSQVCADIYRISRRLRSKNRSLCPREARYLYRSIAEFYEQRDESLLHEAVSTDAYRKLLENYSYKRIALLDAYLEDDNAAPDAFSKLAAKVYVPFLNDVVAHFEDYVVGTPAREVLRLVALLEHYQTHTAGAPFSGYELLPRAVRI